MAAQATARSERFAITHRPDDPSGWLELLASGLTFDLAGLAPDRPAPTPLRRHGFALGEGDLGLKLEAVSLVPGPHLSGGEGLLPVVRVTAGLAAALSTLPGVVAVAWHPAGAWIERKYFARSVAAWLNGGAFPALGLTALAAEPDGTLRSDGLAFFIGQELRLSGEPGDSPADLGKVAVRLIHRLVEGGPLGDEVEFPADDAGGTVRVVPSADGRRLEARRRHG